jgi:short-subunit dehydrogenase
VNNAGIGTFKRADQFSLEEFRAIYQVNVEGTFLFTKYVLPAMIQNKAGQIINISSVAGLNGFKGGSAYAASKFAVNGFTESLREDVKEFGIAVSAVCPGSVATDFGGGSAAALLAKDYAMTPDDVAATVEYLVNESETVNAKLIELKPRRRREFRGK